MFIRVDFPDPDGPMIETKSPRSISNEMPFKTCTGTSPSWKSFTRSLISMMAAIVVTLESRSSAARRCRSESRGRRPKRAPPWPAPRQSRGLRPSGLPLVISVDVPSLSPVVTTTRCGLSFASRIQTAFSGAAPFAGALAGTGRLRLGRRVIAQRALGTFSTFGR